jgi:hypothetical protein
MEWHTCQFEDPKYKLWHLDHLTQQELHHSEMQWHTQIDCVLPDEAPLFLMINPIVSMNNQSKQLQETFQKDGMLLSQPYLFDSPGH